MDKMDLYECWESEVVEKLNEVIEVQTSIAIRLLKKNRSFAIGYFQCILAILWNMNIITIDQYIDAQLVKSFGE